MSRVSTARRDPIAQATAELDALLFEPRSWFAIDAGNVRVPDVWPATLEDALGLIGQGPVATVVGRLRPEIVAVDVDAGGELGAIASQSLAAWCGERGVWCLVRPSGGSQGRAHVLTMPGAQRAGLLHLVDQLRSELGLSRVKLDVRRGLRPLQAPHRRTGPTPPPEAVAAAARDLAALLPAATSPAPVRGRRPGREPAGPRRGAPAGVRPAVPTRRRRRELPKVWRGYLEHGRDAAAAVDDEPEGRSLIELRATYQLVVCGYTEPQAWQAIRGAHPAAFVKARSRGRTWWWYVWNAAVASADSWRQSGHHERPGPTEPHVPAPTDPEAAAARAAIARARVHLESVWRSWPHQTRHTEYDIALTLLDRLERQGKLALHVPQRDLVLDCAVSSRTTAVAALRRIVAREDLFQEEATYAPGTTDTANTIRLHSRHHQGAVSSSGPTSPSPPLRRLPPPLRRALGPAATSALALHLPDAPSPGLTPTEAAHAAGLAPPSDRPLTPSQRRTITQHLTRLASHGLARVDAHGRWHADEPQPGGDLEQRGQEQQHAVELAVANEREAFRDVVDLERRRARWHAERAAAIARSRKSDRARQRQWWHELDPQERARRATERSAAFEALAPSEQATTRAEWTRRRLNAGESERARHQTWWASLSPSERAERAGQRAEQFQRRPAHERIALATAWAQHRTAWGSSRDAPLPHQLPERDLLVRGDGHDPWIDSAPALFRLTNTGASTPDTRVVRVFE